MRRFWKIKTSYFHQFMLRFIVMILIPILCFWWMYEKILTFYYAENVISDQQSSMEGSLSILESALDAAENVFVAVGGNQEIQYYLDYGARNKDMLFSNFKDVYKFCQELYLMTPYLSELKIYSDNSKLIYADPLVRLADFQPGEKVLKMLEGAYLDEIIWSIEDTGDENVLPEVKGYQKIYTEKYDKQIGYIEVKLDARLFEDYFQILDELTDNQDVFLGLYHGENIIYSRYDSSDFYMEKFHSNTYQSGYRTMLAKNLFYNYLEIPKLNMYIVRSGRLFDAGRVPAMNLPSVLISVIILLLLFLFLGFFRNILSLSRRILDFSTYIKEADAEHLVLYQPKKKNVGREDELDLLIDAYNGLIEDKDSLISQIQKMELLALDARFQALQNQMHPHFIYGTLETIRMIALQNRDKEAADMIFSLASMIRYSVSASEKSVKLSEELEIVEHYMQIQKIRFDERIHYSCQVEEHLLGLEVPTFILQPLLENAIIYGISKVLEPCELRLEMYERDGVIVLKASNNGLLITNERLVQVNALLSGENSRDEFKGNHNGLALYNIGQRLSIFFEKQAWIRMSVEDDYTVTKITIKRNQSVAEGEKYVSNIGG